MRTVLAIFLLFSGSVYAASVYAANIELYKFDTAKQEKLYDQLIAELRCLVCQNQNLAESNAELAQDLRKQTYEMVMKGASRGEIVDYMTQRYGDFVLYKPPFKMNTLFLWLGPLLFLLVSAFFISLYFRKQLAMGNDARITEQDKERVKALLDEVKE